MASTFNVSPTNHNEHILKINDETDFAMEKEFFNSGDLQFKSKGFSFQMTPKTNIVPLNEETARLERAYRKYGNNLQDWSNTVERLNK
jgi:hypothetical protein